MACRHRARGERSGDQGGRRHVTHLEDALPQSPI